MFGRQESRSIYLLLVIGLLIVLATPAFGQSNNDRGDGDSDIIQLDFSNNPTEPTIIAPKPVPNTEAENSVKPLPEAISEPPITTEEGSAALEDIRIRLRNETQTLQQSARDISILEDKLNQANEAVTTLEQQLSQIDAQIEVNRTKIVYLEKQIAQLIKDITATKAEITETIAKVNDQKELVKDYLNLIYSQNVNVGNFDTSLSQTVRLLFADKEANVLLSDLYALELLEEGRRQAVVDLVDTQEKLQSQQKTLETQRDLQTSAQKELLTQQSVLEAQRLGKQKLLEETQGEEELYRELLAAGRASQAKIRDEISSLQASYAQVVESLGETDSDGKSLGILPNDAKLSWPMQPTRGVSAFFRDPSYKAALGLEHNAIDIRAPMATPIKAPADGVVYKVKGGEGLDYHYIIIAHRDEIMTLYGHVYQELVDIGDTVSKGQIIGLSGGAPGTRGAGYLTTGPHLHFEVFKDGRHVDPMHYLDLSEIEEKFIPDQYL